MKHLVAVLVGVAAGIAFAVTAHVAWAHPVADFYGPRWVPPSVTYHYTTSVPAGEWRTSVDASATTWSNVNGSTFDFVKGADVADFDPSVCNTSGVNGIHRISQGSDGAGGVLGRTFMCWSGSGAARAFTSMQVRFDSAENFYTGSGTPASNQPDLRSVATHELGHGTGFGVGAPNNHFDGNDTTICAFNSGEQTMCPTHQLGSTWQRSLGEHDQHTFAAAYPGPVTTTTTAGGGSTTTTTRPTCSKGCSTSTTSGGTTSTTGGSTTTTGGGTTTTRPKGSTTTLPGGSTTTRPPK